MRGINTMEKNEDRRVRKTKKLLKNGLAELMKEKPIKNITVRELSELVDINRGTFYLHYKDIYDMVEQIQDELFTEFNQIIEEHEFDNTDNSLFPMLVDIFKHIADNAEMVQSLIGKNGSAIFVDKLKNVVKEKCLSNMYTTLKPDKNIEFKYFYFFVISGCIGIFHEWLNNGMKENPKEIALIVENLILKGFNSLK